MINKTLFKNKDEETIAKLKIIINKFKKYDKERKIFYQERIKRLDNLEHYVLNLEKEISKLREKNSEQSIKLNKLNKYIKYYTDVDINQSIDDLKQKLDYESIKKRNLKLQKENKILKNSINQLTNILVKNKLL